MIILVKADYLQCPKPIDENADWPFHSSSHSHYAINFHTHQILSIFFLLFLFHQLSLPTFLLTFLSNQTLINSSLRFRLPSDALILIFYFSLNIVLAAIAIIIYAKMYSRGQGWVTYSSSAVPKFSPRKEMDIKVTKVASFHSNTKKAKLYAARKERVKLPTYGDGIEGTSYHISEFLSHPSGIEAVLNTRALQSFEPLGANTYRCTLPKLQLLNFEAVPLLDLRVMPTNEDCMVEMLSCKFEGSEVVESQNNHFSAFMINHMTWGVDDAESFLEVDIKLNLTLEIYTRPFTMMPVSAVERPGNLMVQTLVDQLAPLLIRQLLQDYDEWVQKQLQTVT